MRYILYIILFFAPFCSFAQFSINSDLENINYSNPKEYEVGGVIVTGTQFFDTDAIISLSGLTVGDKVTVPGDRISKAIRNLWSQKLFSDVKLVVNKIEGDKVFLEIRITELPKLSKYKFEGVKKAKQKDLREEIGLIRGKVVTENLIMSTENRVKNYFVNKGFLNTDVNIEQVKDSSFANNIILVIKVDINKRTKIKDINFYGNNSIKEKKLRKGFKDTKRNRIYNIFSVSKYIPKSYNDEKYSVVNAYNEKGYRDAKIVSDSVYRVNKKHVSIDITVDEGRQYYFRNIKWVGNTIHPTAKLDRILDIDKGDVYNKKILDERLFMNQNGRDISSLYLDDGYLFFNINPVEVRIDNDSIDLEMRLYEGKQARINHVTIVGNSKTNDHVIRRERVQGNYLAVQILLEHREN